MQKDVSDGDVAGLFLSVPPGCGDSLSAPSVKPGERLGASEWSLFSLPHCFALPCRLHLTQQKKTPRSAGCFGTSPGMGGGVNHTKSK